MANKVIDKASKKRVTERMDNLITETYKKDDTERTYYTDTDALEWRNGGMHGCILGEYEVIVVEWMGVFYREHGSTVHYERCRTCGECKIREFIEDGMPHEEPTKR